MSEWNPRVQRRLVCEHARGCLAGTVGAVGAVLRSVLVLIFAGGQRPEELEARVGAFEPLAIPVREERDLVLALAVFLSRRDLLRDEVDPELRQSLPDGGRVRAPLGLVERQHVAMLDGEKTR